MAHSIDAEVPTSPIILAVADGTVVLQPIANGRFRVNLHPVDPNRFIPLGSCETSLPAEVIKAFLNRSFAWLCDALARHDDPEYIMRILEGQMLAYCDAAEFRGKRLLDFGCGSGASTLCIAARFPETEVVGIELDEGNIELARKVLAARGLSNVRFFTSPDGSSLPPGIGDFDFVMFSAVYEHLLPDERLRVMPLVWASMKPGACLFINQTPYRYFPYEHHSTGLWFINYLPDGVSLWLARNFSRLNPEVSKTWDWNAHLRGGIRGGTEGEVLSNLRLADSGKPTVLQPKRSDRAAYWLSCTNPDRHRALKSMVAAVFRLTDRFLGTVPSMNLDVVIRKS